LIKIVLALLITSPLHANVADWKRGIAAVESSADGYVAVNTHTNALGKYQFVPKWWWKSIAEYAIIKGVDISSHEDFLNNPEFQEQFMEYVYTSQYLGQADKIKQATGSELSIEELAALIHFKGYSDALRWVKTGQDRTPDNNIPIEKYLEIFNKYRNNQDGK